MIDRGVEVASEQEGGSKTQISFAIMSNLSGFEVHERFACKRPDLGGRAAVMQKLLGAFEQGGRIGVGTPRMDSGTECVDQAHGSLIA